MIYAILGTVFLTAVSTVATTFALTLAKPVGRDILVGEAGAAAMIGLSVLALFATACHNDDAR